MTEVVLEDQWTDWGRSGGVLVEGANRLSWEIATMAPGLLQEALLGIRSAVTAGASLTARLTGRGGGGSRRG